MDWYRTMAGMYDNRDGEGDGVVLGEVPITARLLKWFGIALALFAAQHIGRIAMGQTGWLGFAQTNMQAAPGWMRTPVSSNMLGDGFGASLPMPAHEGQEIVVRYRLTAPESDAAAPRATVLVTCFCAATNWDHFTISGAGSGELVMPVGERDFYRVTVRQSVGANGTTSSGLYYWGVRDRQSQ